MKLTKQLALELTKYLRPLKLCAFDVGPCEAAPDAEDRAVTAAKQRSSLLTTRRSAGTNRKLARKSRRGLFCERKAMARRCGSRGEFAHPAA
jgi:hypothetical protein